MPQSLPDRPGDRPRPHLDDSIGLPDVEDGLGRGRRPAYHPPVGEPKHAPVDGARDGRLSPTRHATLVERPSLMRAAVCEREPPIARPIEEYLDRARLDAPGF